MQKTLGVVLKKQNIGETDRILTIMSPTLGKKRVIARAVRKPLSKMAGHLDTLMLSQLILTDDPELPTITSVQLIEPFAALRLSLEQTTRAQAVSRVIERVILEDTAQRPIFQLTVEALHRVNDQLRWSNVWLKFLFDLARHLGVQPDVRHCSDCQKEISDEAWRVAELRSVLCPHCASRQPTAVIIPSNALKLLRLFGSHTFATVERIRIPDPVAQMTEQILLEEITQWLNKPWQHYAGLARG